MMEAFIGLVFIGVAIGLCVAIRRFIIDKFWPEP